MPETDATQSGVMARLTLSALERASQDPDCWREPVVHRALLVSGLRCSPRPPVIFRMISRRLKRPEAGWFNP